MDAEGQDRVRRPLDPAVAWIRPAHPVPGLPLRRAALDTLLEVYFDFMRSFHMEFRSLSEEGLISSIEIGLGASGELRYLSCPEKMGWRYTGIGEFQCFDRYMQKKLRESALARGHLFWARGPANAGYYNSRSHETGFFL